MLVRNCVGAIRIDGKQNIWMAAPHFSHDINIPTGFDLEFDSLITERQIFVHAFQQFIETALNAETDANGNAFAHASDQLR